MVSIHDILEDAFVYERVASYTWIGFRKTANSASWNWSDGTSANFTNWCDGQPVGDEERFAWMPSGSEYNGCWWTSGVDDYAPVVCKVPEQD